MAISSDWRSISRVNQLLNTCGGRVFTIEKNPHVSEPAHFTSVLLAQGKSYMAQHYLGNLKKYTLYILIYLYVFLDKSIHLKSGAGAGEMTWSP